VSGLVGVTSSGERTYYDLAFVGAVGVGALALRALGRVSQVLTPLSRTERFVGEWCGVFLATAVFVASISLAAELVGQGSGATPPVALLLVAAHTTGITVLVSRVPTSTGLRVALLVALLWWIPSALTAGAGWLEPLAQLLDPSTHLATLSTPVETPPAALTDMAPSAATALAAWLLDPPAFSRR
jgi:hypothetical protein